MYRDTTGEDTDRASLAVWRRLLRPGRPRGRGHLPAPAPGAAGAGCRRPWPARRWAGTAAAWPGWRAAETTPRRGSAAAAAAAAAAAGGGGPWVMERGPSQDAAGHARQAASRNDWTRPPLSHNDTNSWPKWFDIRPHRRRERGSSNRYRQVAPLPHLVHRFSKSTHDCPPNVISIGSAVFAAAATTPSTGRGPADRTPEILHTNTPHHSK